MATRKTDWPKRLTDYLISVQDAPFEYGNFDCLCFVAGAIEAMTGVDIMADFRGRYTSHLQAMRIAKSVYGTSNVPDTLAAMMCQRGWQALSPLLAQRGDVVLVRINDRIVCGIIHPSGKEAVAITNEGLWRFSLKNVKRAWGIR
jgi:hypothetical protein